MIAQAIRLVLEKIFHIMLSVHVRTKIAGIALVPVLILGLSLNYWIKTGLSDWLSYLLSNQRVAVAMQAGSRSVIFVTILAGITSILFAYFLTYLFTHPLLSLHEVALQVIGGNLAARATVWSEDEIGVVARSVNTMIDRLVASQTQLTLANHRLEAMNRVAMAAGRELELPEVFDAALDGILDVLGLKSGWVYLRESDSEHFYLAYQRGMPEQIANATLQDDLCPCLKNLLHGQVDATAVLLEDDCAMLAGLLAENSARYRHIAIPLRARNQVFGVINLLCEDGYQPAQDDMELISAMGVQASEIIMNVWLHARLVEKEAARKVLLTSLVNTQEDERRRLARELHDGAGQTLTNLLVRLRTLQKKAAPGEMNDDLGRLQDLVAESIEQVRELSYRLRPATLEEFGLALAIKNLVEDMAGEAGLKVVSCLDLDQGENLSDEIEIALYRIAQECLTNIIRHANATKIEVELLRTPVGLSMRIDDDGCGFLPDQLAPSVSQPHLGLISMQERAEMLGGSLAVFSAPQAGTSVQVRVPLV